MSAYNLKVTFCLFFTYGMHTYVENKQNVILAMHNQCDLGGVKIKCHQEYKIKNCPTLMHKHI